MTSRPDLSRDDLRRRLRDVDQANRAAMPAFRDALHRFVAPGSGLTTAERAAVLGLPEPGRRRFLRFGGVAVLGGALLAACSDDDEGVLENGGRRDDADRGADLDGVLARTAASVEALAVAAYQAAIDADLLARPVAAVAAVFRDHHQEHQDTLNAVATDAGGRAVTEPNAVLFEALVTPVLEAEGGPTEASLLELAYSLETAAVRAYSFAGGTLSTPRLRQSIMTIGGVESRHAAVLKLLAQGAAPPQVFYDGAFISAPDAGLPDEALLT